MSVRILINPREHGQGRLTSTLVLLFVLMSVMAPALAGDRLSAAHWQAIVAAHAKATLSSPSQQAYLKASNADAFDRFGRAVAVSGNTVVVGAIDEGSSSTTINGDQTDNSRESGAVYVFVREGTAWTQQAYLKTRGSHSFGYSVAVSGDTIVVGDPNERSAATGIDGDQEDESAPVAGAAYVFVRSGTTWTQQAYLKASNTEAFNYFGTAVAVSGDTVLVGAPGERSSATGVSGSQVQDNPQSTGAAYVFVRSGGSWTQQAYLKASNTGVFDDFGQAVALSGDTALVGAPGEDSGTRQINGAQGDNSAFNAGAAYVFVRAGTQWSQQAYLKASNASAFDEFARFDAVAIDGDTIVIGAPNEDSAASTVNGGQDDDSAEEAGAAYVFTRSGAIWAQQAYLKASNSESSDFFGSSVAVSGDACVVGTHAERSAATGINGNLADNSAFNAGAAYVFVRDGSAWTQRAYLKAGNTGEGDEFGLPVALSGNTMVAGAAGEDSAARGIDGDGSNNDAAVSGAAYIFALGLAPPASGGTLRNVNRFGQPSDPLAGATLTLYVGDQTFATAVSAADGSYAFEGLEAPDELFDLRIQSGEVVRVYQAIRPSQLEALSLTLPVDVRARLNTELGKLEDTPPLYLAYDTSGVRELLARWNNGQPEDASVHAQRDLALGRMLFAAEGKAQLFASVEPLGQDAAKLTVDTVTTVLSIRKVVQDASKVLANAAAAAAPDVAESVLRLALQAFIKTSDIFAGRLQATLTDGVKATLPPFATELFEDALGIIAKGVLGAIGSAQWDVPEGRKALLTGLVETLAQEIGGRVIGSGYVAQTQLDLQLAEVRARILQFDGTPAAAFSASNTVMNEAVLRIDDARNLTSALGETGKEWSAVADASVLAGRIPGAQLAAALGAVIKGMSVGQLVGATIFDFLVLTETAFERSPLMTNRAFFPAATKASNWHAPLRWPLAHGKTLPAAYTDALAALRAGLVADDADAVLVALEALLAAEDGLADAIDLRRQRLNAHAANATAGFDDAARLTALERIAVFDVERALLYAQVAGYLVPALADPATTPADIVAQLDTVSSSGVLADDALATAEAPVQASSLPAMLVVECHGLGESLTTQQIAPGLFDLRARLRNVGDVDIANAALQLSVELADGSTLTLQLDDPAQQALGPIAAGALREVVWSGVVALPADRRDGEAVSYRLVPLSAGVRVVAADGGFVVANVPGEDIFHDGFEQRP